MNIENLIILIPVIFLVLLFGGIMLCLMILIAGECIEFYLKEGE